MRDASRLGTDGRRGCEDHKLSPRRPNVIHNLIPSLCVPIVTPLLRFPTLMLAAVPLPGLLLDPIGQLGHLVVNGPAFGHEGADLAVRYIAIWRAVTSTRDREVPHRSSMDSPK